MILLLSLFFNHSFAADPKPASSPTQVVQITDTSATVKTNFGSQVNALRTSSLLGNQFGLIDFGPGTSTASSTVRTESNQGLPNSIANSWPMKITDGSDNTTVKVVKENMQYATSDFGLPIYGVDPDTPRKYRPLRLDAQGDIYTHDIDPNNNSITSTTSGTKIGKDVAVIKSVLPDGAATEFTLSLLNTNVVSGHNTIIARQNTMIANQQLLQSSVSGTNTRIDSANTNLTTINTSVLSGTTAINSSLISNTTQTVSGNLTIIGWLTSIYNRLGDKSQFTKITGGDGLYNATVDSLNRLSVNANINFPEAVYTYPSLLNGTSKAMNVNGSVTPVSFTYAPASGTTFYVEDISYFIADNAAFTTGGFGALAALTNGLIIEYQSKGVLYTLTNIQDNSDLSMTFSDSSFGQINAGLLATDAYLTGAKRFQQRIALDGSLGDFFRARVRDNLTGLTTLNIKVRAWRVN